jgi:hypothetical protein
VGGWEKWAALEVFEALAIVIIGYMAVAERFAKFRKRKSHFFTVAVFVLGIPIALYIAFEVPRVNQRESASQLLQRGKEDVESALLFNRSAYSDCLDTSFVSSKLSYALSNNPVRVPSQYLEVVKDKDVMASICPSIEEVFVQTSANILQLSENLHGNSARNNVLVGRLDLYCEELAYARDMLAVAFLFVSDKIDSAEVESRKGRLIVARMTHGPRILIYPNGSRDTLH